MTPNMIITLLRIYRGDFKTMNASDERDVGGLLGWKLIEKTDEDGVYFTTKRGDDYIRHLREVSP